MFTLPRERDLAIEQIQGLYEFLGNQRKLFLYGPIVGYPERTDTFGPTWIIDALQFLDATDKEKPIVLTIDSIGGSIDDGLLLCDVIKSVTAPVYTVGRNCYSLAVAILASGTPGCRFVYPHSRVMLHDPNYHLGGGRMTEREMSTYTQQLQRSKQAILEILINNGARKTREEIITDIDREGDYYLTGQAIIDYGIADKMIMAQTDISMLTSLKGGV